MEGEVLNMLFIKGFTGKVTFEQKCEGIISYAVLPHSLIPYSLLVTLM